MNQRIQAKLLREIQFSFIAHRAEGGNMRLCVQALTAKVELCFMRTIRHGEPKDQLQ